MDFSEKKTEKISENLIYVKEAEDLVYIHETEGNLTLKDNSVMEQIHIHKFTEEEAKKFLEEYSPKDVTPKSKKQSKREWKKKQKKLNEMRLNENLAKDMEDSFMENVEDTVTKQRILQQDLLHKAEIERKKEENLKKKIEEWAENTCALIEEENQKIKKQRRENFKGNKYESAAQRWEREDALEAELEEEKQQIRKELKEQLILKKMQKDKWRYVEKPNAEEHLEEVQQRQKLLYDKIMGLSMYYDVCEYMDENMKKLEQYSKLVMQGKLNEEEKKELFYLIGQMKENLKFGRYHQEYQYCIFNEGFLNPKYVGDDKEHRYNAVHFSEEHKLQLEEKFGKYMEINELGRLDVGNLRNEKNNFYRRYAMHRLNGIYEYLGDEKTFTEYKRLADWYNFLEETLEANREIRIKLKNEFKEEYLEQRDEEMLGIVFVDAFLHKKRIDWEKWYRQNGDCFMNEQQQEIEEKRLRDRKEEEEALCYQECEKMETHIFKEQLKVYQSKSFFDLSVDKATKDLRDLKRVRNIMLHMVKEHRALVSKLISEYVEKQNITEISSMNAIKEEIEIQFKKLTFGEVWEALSNKKRIDLEKWYRKEEDYYKPLVGKMV